MAQADVSEFERNDALDTFILIGYDVLRGTKPGTTDRYDFMHVVWTGFNKAARKMFESDVMVDYCKTLAGAGLVELRPAKGGAILKPLIGLLTEPTEQQKTLGVSYRRFLVDFKIAEDDERARRTAAKAAPPVKASPKVKAAAKIFDAGDVTAALARLGYPTK